jgi:hypothetical protein
MAISTASKGIGGMKGIPMRALAFTAAVGLAAPLLAGERAAQMPAWMAGGWELSNGPQWVDEYWTPPRAGMMIGNSRTGKGEELQFFEQLSIVRKPDGSLSYIAMPKGAPTTEFALTRSGPMMIEFTNPAHDYPQRIKYWREGCELRAEISLIDGTKAERWTYRPVAAKAQRRN